MEPKSIKLLTFFVLCDSRILAELFAWMLGRIMSLGFTLFDKFFAWPSLIVLSLLFFDFLAATCTLVFSNKLIYSFT